MLTFFRDPESVYIKGRRQRFQFRHIHNKYLTIHIAGRPRSTTQSSAFPGLRESMSSRIGKMNRWKGKSGRWQIRAGIERRWPMAVDRWPLADKILLVRYLISSREMKEHHVLSLEKFRSSFPGRRKIKIRSATSNEIRPTAIAFTEYSSSCSIPPCKHQPPAAAFPVQ